LSLFKHRRFPIEIILLCVRWYCKYGISYRDLAEMMQERGVEVDPPTIFAGCSATRRRSRRGSADIRASGLVRGVWMRPTYGSEGAGRICSERSTNMVS
jgi:hypothetical protein